MHFVREPHERLQWARQQKGYRTATEAAKAMGVPGPTYLGHENGSRGFAARAPRYARFFGVSLDWLLGGRGQPKGGAAMRKQAVGYIGAGAEIHPIDDHAQGAGLEEVDIPPGVPADVVPVIVRGDSMWPRYFDGEFLFYSREERAPEELLGRECAVRLKNGQMLVKILRKGSKRGVFNLESWNAPLMEDQAVEWAAPVRGRG